MPKKRRVGERGWKKVKIYNRPRKASQHDEIIRKQGHDNREGEEFIREYGSDAEIAEFERQKVSESMSRAANSIWQDLLYGF